MGSTGATRTHQVLRAVEAYLDQLEEERLQRQKAERLQEALQRKQSQTYPDPLDLSEAGQKQKFFFCGFPEFFGQNFLKLAKNRNLAQKFIIFLHSKVFALSNQIELSNKFRLQFRARLLFINILI